jgi:hypothetical protein
VNSTGWVATLVREEGSKRTIVGAGAIATVAVFTGTLKLVLALLKEAVTVRVPSVRNAVEQLAVKLPVASVGVEHNSGTGEEVEVSAKLKKPVGSIVPLPEGVVRVAERVTT